MVWRIRPSLLPSLAVCPSYRQDEKLALSPATKMGTVVHEALETYVEGGMTDAADVAARKRANELSQANGLDFTEAYKLLEKGQAALRLIMSEPHTVVVPPIPEVKLDMTIGEWELTGTADMIRVYRQNDQLVLHVMDWKTTWLPDEYGSAAENLQTMAYGLMALDRYEKMREQDESLPKIGKLRLDFVFLRAKASVDADVKLLDVDGFRDQATRIIEEVMRKAMDLESRRTPNPSCAYCEKALTCEAFTGEIRRNLVLFGEETPPEMDPTDGDQLARIWMFARYAERVAGRARDFVRQIVHNLGGVRGKQWELVQTSRTRTQGITPDVVRVAGLRAGLTIEQVNELLKMIESTREKVPYMVVTLRKAQKARRI